MEAVEEKPAAKGRPRLIAWVCRLVLMAVLLVLIGYAGVIARELTRSVQPAYVKSMRTSSPASARKTDQPTSTTESADFAIVDAKTDLFPITDKIPEQDRGNLKLLNDSYRQVMEQIDQYWAKDPDLNMGDPRDYYLSLIGYVNVAHSALTSHSEFTKDEASSVRLTLAVTEKRIEEAMVDCFSKQRRWYDLAQYYQSRRDWDSELFYLRQMGPAGRSVIIWRVTERCVDLLVRPINTMHMQWLDAERRKAFSAGRSVNGAG